MLEIACFDIDAQKAPDYRTARACVLMVYARNVCGERHALRMVARRACDNAFLLFLGSELRNFIVCAADIEGTRLLQVLRFQPQIVFIGQLACGDNVRLINCFFEHLLRVKNFVNRQHDL